MRRTLPLLLAVTLSVLPLAACSTGQATAPHPAKPMTQQQVGWALLSLVDIGPRATQVGVASSGDSPSGDSSMGCLGKSALFAGHLRATHSMTVNLRQAGVLPENIYDTVATYRTTTKPAGQLTAAKRVMASCRNVHFVIHGGTFNLHVATDSQKLAPQVDQEVNVAATGHGHFPGAKLAVPLRVYISASRIHNDVTLVVVVGYALTTRADLVRDTTAAVRDLTTALAGHNPHPPVTE